MWLLESSTSPTWLACMAHSVFSLDGDGVGDQTIPCGSVWRWLGLVLWPRAWNASPLLFQLFSSLLSPRLECSCFTNETFPQKTSRELSKSSRDLTRPVAMKFQGHWAQELPGAKPWEGTEVRREYSPLNRLNQRGLRGSRDFPNPGFWCQEMDEAPISKMHDKTARKWASHSGPSVHYLWQWGISK